MSSSRIPLLVVALVLLSGPTQAAKAAPAGAFGTREQLRECLDLDASMKLRGRDLEAAAVAHNQKFDANEAEGADLVKMKASLDRNDRNAILAFNKAVQDHNLHIQQIDQEAAEAEHAASTYASDKAAMDQKCGSLTYRPVDMDAVTKERRKAAALATATAASAP